MQTKKDASVDQIITVGLDLAKHVFQVHGADRDGTVVMRKKLRREQLLGFFAELPRCTVAMEACGGAHHWAREIGQLGHDVKLIAPAYVKPFVKRQKNDMADAEAICEAAQRPTIRFVPVKSEMAQASALVFRTRDLLVRQRTQLINALRGHMTEFGMVVAQGPMHVARLIAIVEDQDSDAGAGRTCQQNGPNGLGAARPWRGLPSSGCGGVSRQGRGVPWSRLRSKESMAQRS